MDHNLKIVSDFYSSEPIMKETREADASKNGLKIWEKSVAATFFPAKENVLDIGCGTGREAFSLCDMGLRVTGIDICEYRIETAKQLAAESNRNVTFLLTDGLDLPFDSGTFDIVVLWAQTFGQFYGKENQLLILKECYRVLKSEGILSFSGHDKEFLEKNYSRFLEGKKFFAYANTDCYWEIFTADEMRELAVEAGFEVLECGRGKVYQEEEGTILHCECTKRGIVPKGE